MQLPFLKARRTPRVKSDDSSVISVDSDDDFDLHVSRELISALESKDVRSFRDAIEALVLNAFECEEDDDAIKAR